MSDQVDNPLKWLLAQLPSYIAADDLALLMRCYEVNKAAYARQIKINQAERVIKSIQLRNRPADAAKLARWHTKLAKLKEQPL